MTRVTTAREPEAENRNETEPFDRRLQALRDTVDRGLAAFLSAKIEAAQSRAPGSGALARTVERLVGAGGKRLRPALVLATYQAVGGRRPEAVLPLAMATELLHTYLLIHDDIMDRAAVRRGTPTAHEAFATHHRVAGWPGEGAHFGSSVAILAGDLAATWAMELSRLGEQAEGSPHSVAATFTAMCEEVIGGQYLEMTLPLAARVGEEPSEEDLLRVLRLKSGRYSVERPIELGALAAGAGDETLTPLATYGSSLGEAFQLQDDLLGLFGDAEEVGKPVGSDLGEGKYTLLVHHALAGASTASDEDRRWLRAALGRPDLEAADVERAREILVTSGARRTVEVLVAERLAAARRALGRAPIDPAGAAFFHGLADYLEGRTR